jgi:hypothetical protein
MALECELMRESNNQVKFDKMISAILPCHALQRVELPGVLKPVDVHGVSFGPSSLNCPDIRPGAESSPHSLYQVAKRVIEKLNNEEKRNVFIVANMGLWYNDPQYLEETIVPVLDWLNTVASNKAFNNLIFWQETMSQHWPNNYGSGYFDKDLGFYHKRRVLDKLDENSDPMQFHVPGCCSVISNKSAELDWRNNIVKQKLLNYPLIRLLPFADVTKEMADMHLCSPKSPKQDCTQYCYWPLLWQLFWHQLNQYSMETTASPSIQ